MHQRRGQRVARGDSSGAGANTAPAPAKPTRAPAMRSGLGVTDPSGNAAADRAVLAKTRGLGMLRVWLVVVSSMRLLSVYLGFRDVARFRTHMFPNAPDQGAQRSVLVAVGPCQSRVLPRLTCCPLCDSRSVTDLYAGRCCECCAVSSAVRGPACAANAHP